jgi:hypothetical protein
MDYLMVFIRIVSSLIYLESIALWDLGIL